MYTVTVIPNPPDGSGTTKPKRAVRSVGPPPALPKAVPLLRVQMAKRGVRSVRALYGLLEPYDKAYSLRLSLMQLHKLVNGEAKQINVEGLCAICAVLQCNVHDLYDVRFDPQSSAGTEAKNAP